MRQTSCGEEGGRSGTEGTEWKEGGRERGSRGEEVEMGET